MTDYDKERLKATSQDYHNLSRIGRQRAGMSQEQWAEAVGVSVRSIGDYEAGVKIPSASTAVRMEAASAFSSLRPAPSSATRAATPPCSFVCGKRTSGTPK